MARTTIGVDFGLSVTDAVLVQGQRVVQHVAMHRPGPASQAVLERALQQLGNSAVERTTLIGVTGGRSGLLPAEIGGRWLQRFAEPEAVGRGGLALAGVRRALVVSCGTGTSMIAADADSASYVHVSGTAMGGGTLEGLARHLLGVRNATDVAALAQGGDASGVDTTLAEALGSGVGELPPSATAVNLGRLAELESPAPPDLAAGLVTMVAQTISLIALNAARSAKLSKLVFIGRLAEFDSVRAVVRNVCALYDAPAPLFPERAALATALGAALAAQAAES